MSHPLSLRAAVIVAALVLPGLPFVRPHQAQSRTPPSANQTSSGAHAFVFEIDELSTTLSRVGRRVMLWDVTVEEITSTGFWVSSPSSMTQAFVRAAEGSWITLRRGQSVSIRGEVRPMPVSLHRSLNIGDHDKRHQLYVYAYTVRPAWQPN
jgi:hypothetical protein